jgi:hypothetical protein
VRQDAFEVISTDGTRLERRDVPCGLPDSTL